MDGSRANRLSPLRKRARKRPKPRKPRLENAAQARRRLRPASAHSSPRLQRNDAAAHYRFRPPHQPASDARPGRDRRASSICMALGVEMARMRLLRLPRSARGAGPPAGSGHHRQRRLALHPPHACMAPTHFHAPEREGRLRRLLPEWLHEAGIPHASFQAFNRPIPSMAAAVPSM